MGEALVGRPYKFVESSLSMVRIPDKRIWHNFSMVRKLKLSGVLAGEIVFYLQLIQPI